MTNSQHRANTRIPYRLIRSWRPGNVTSSGLAKLFMAIDVYDRQLLKAQTTSEKRLAIIRTIDAVNSFIESLNEVGNDSLALNTISKSLNQKSFI